MMWLLTFRVVRAVGKRSEIDGGRCLRKAAIDLLAIFSDVSHNLHGAAAGLAGNDSAMDQSKSVIKNIPGRGGCGSAVEVVFCVVIISL